MTIATKKVSAWLSEEIGSGHTAVDVKKAAADFSEKTGEAWPPYLQGRPVKQLLAEGRKHYKGLQVWKGDKDAYVVGGWQVASALCAFYLPAFHPVSFGRGSEFAECVEALEKAGI